MVREELHKNAVWNETSKWYVKYYAKLPGRIKTSKWYMNKVRHTTVADYEHY